jgi:hypothetical protein
MHLRIIISLFDITLHISSHFISCVKTYLTFALKNKLNYTKQVLSEDVSKTPPKQVVRGIWRRTQDQRKNMLRTK